MLGEGCGIRGEFIREGVFLVGLGMLGKGEGSRAPARSGPPQCATHRSVQHCPPQQAGGRWGWTGGMEHQGQGQCQGTMGHRVSILGEGYLWRMGLSYLSKSVAMGWCT